MKLTDQELSRIFCDADTTMQGLHAIQEAVLARQPAASEPLAWIHEDELPEGYPYDAMYPYSKVDGVRLFPVYGPAASEAGAAPLRAAYDALQFYVDAHDDELSERGITREDALRLAREAQAQLIAAPAVHPTAYCQPDDPDSSSAFSWPGMGRKKEHVVPLFGGAPASAPAADLHRELYFAAYALMDSVCEDHPAIADVFNVDDHGRLCSALAALDGHYGIESPEDRARNAPATESAEPGLMTSVEQELVRRGIVKPTAATADAQVDKSADLQEKPVDESQILQSQDAQGDERAAFEKAYQAEYPEAMPRDDGGQYWHPKQRRCWAMWQARAAISRQPSAPASAEYTDAIGDAGERYMSKFEYAHPLPAQFRWQELWDAMRSTAAKKGGE